MGVDAMKSHPISPSDHRRRRRSRFPFPKGSLVEVQTNEEGLKDVYFSATVAPPPSRRKKSRKLLYIEYHNLVVEDNESEKLREYVDVSLVRPTPPALQEEEESARAFQPDDVVDAFYNDGWWMGVVSRVVEGGELLVVTFQNPPDVREFRISDIRVHWDWVNGIWEKQQSLAFMTTMFEVGRTVEISIDEGFDRDAWIPAIIHKHLENGVLLVEYDIGEDVIAEVDIRNVRPCPLALVKDEKKFVLLEEIDAYIDHVWRSAVITKLLENDRCIVFLKKTKQYKELCQWDLRPLMEWKDGKWLLSSISDDGVVDGKMCLKKRRKYPFDSETVVENVEEGTTNIAVQIQDSLGGKMVQVNNSESLPFVKDRNTSSVWEAIESMRVFQRIPQKPHFKPLERIKESSREGYAIGYMVSFARLVERACNLQLNDPKGMIDKIMEELAEMEGYGFDVSIVRDKLTKLLDLKVELEKLVDEVNKCHNHISEHREESKKIYEEMRQLQEKLSLAESTKEKEDSEIALLQAGLEVAQVSIKIVG